MWEKIEKSMDYKKLIKNRKTRIRIMQALSIVPDQAMVKIQYRIKTGHKLDLKNPKRFTEKLQWYKLNYRDPLMAQCSDKYEVRKYVEECGLGDILNDLYGVYDSPDEIDFKKLPESFVLKDTLGAGGNAVILVQDKSQMDEDAVRKQMWDWVNEPVHSKHPGREWVYEGRKHRIVAEKMLMSKEKHDLPDYKFFCFEGKPFCLYFMQNYTMNHSNGEMGFFDCEFRLLPAHRQDFKQITLTPPKPQNFEEMVRISKTISAGFPHVRVDLFNINGRIIFGEMTFFNASGYTTFEPDEFDYILGEKFILADARKHNRSSVECKQE